MKAQTPSAVQALPTVRRGDEARFALALKASLCIKTASILTNVWLLSTLIDVFAIILKSQLAEPRRANAGKRSDEVLAAELAVVCFSPTLIHVPAVPAVWSQLVAIGTDTSVRPWGVVAPEGAMVADVTAFINIFAGAKRSWSVASGTRAKESTKRVCARAIATQLTVLVAFIAVNTLSS